MGSFKKAVKLTAVIISLVMMVSVFSACSSKYYIKPYDLVSENSDEETKQLFDWLQTIYGKKIISGQQMYSPASTEEYTIYRETGGKLPAIKGFDFLEVTNGNKSQVDMAIKWHTESNGIVTMCWHWAPKTSTKGAMSAGNPYNIEKVLANKDGQEYKDLIKDIDTIAGELKRMQDAGVPVLWRPLHEAAGGWFWWGAKGPFAYKELWNIMFDRLENYHKLTNLIWVWNGQDQDWYVGDDKCDIVGHDIYFVKDISLSQRTYNYLSGYEWYNKNVTWCNNTKMVALTECDQIPDPDNLFDASVFKSNPDEPKKEDIFASEEWYRKKTDTTPWLFWCVWWGGMVNTEEYTKFDKLNEIYNNEYVVTWEDLPKWDEDTRRELGAGTRRALGMSN